MSENQGGRPTRYTPELAEEICRRLAESGNLREVCRAEDMPNDRTVRSWALEDRDGFAEKYRAAREIGYHAMADEVLEIADDGRNDWMMRDGAETLNSEAIQRSRLRFDARRWLLSKALPKIYGEKVTQEISGPNGGPIPVTRVEIVPLKPNDHSAD